MKVHPTHPLPISASLAVHEFNANLNSVLWIAKESGKLFENKQNGTNIEGLTTNEDNR